MGAREQARFDPLSGHLQESESRDSANLDAGLVSLEGLLQDLLHLAAVLIVAHIDEVDDEEAADVPKSDLSGHHLRRFDVRLEGHLVLILLSPGLAGVDVNGGEGFRRVDDDAAAALQGHVMAGDELKLPLKAEVAEDRHLAVIRRYALHDVGRVSLEEVRRAR